MIMTSFKKVFNLKIVTGIVSIVFLCNTTLYACPIPERSEWYRACLPCTRAKRVVHGPISEHTLRVPIGKSTMERVNELMQAAYDAHDEETPDQDPKAIDVVIKYYADRQEVPPFSKFPNLEETDRDTVNRSGATEMQGRLDSSGVQMQLIFVETEKDLPVEKIKRPDGTIEERKVWGHASSKYITVFAVKEEKYGETEEALRNSEEIRRRIIGRASHEKRARSTIARERFDKIKWDELTEEQAMLKIAELQDQFEDENKRIQKEIEEHGEIQDETLRQEFARLEFDEELSIWNRDYAMAFWSRGPKLEDHEDEIVRTLANGCTLRRLSDNGPLDDTLEELDITKVKPDVKARLLAEARAKRKEILAQRMSDERNTIVAALSLFSDPEEKLGGVLDAVIGKQFVADIGDSELETMQAKASEMRRTLQRDAVQHAIEQTVETMSAMELLALWYDVPKEMVRVRSIFTQQSDASYDRVNGSEDASRKFDDILSEVSEGASDTFSPHERLMILTEAIRQRRSQSLENLDEHIDTIVGRLVGQLVHREAVDLALELVRSSSSGQETSLGAFRPTHRGAGALAESLQTLRGLLRKNSVDPIFVNLQTIGIQLRETLAQLPDRREAPIEVVAAVAQPGSPRARGNISSMRSANNHQFLQGVRAAVDILGEHPTLDQVSNMGKVPVWVVYRRLKEIFIASQLWYEELGIERPSSKDISYWKRGLKNPDATRIASSPRPALVRKPAPVERTAPTTTDAPSLAAQINAGKPFSETDAEPVLFDGRELLRQGVDLKKAVDRFYNEKVSRSPKLKGANKVAVILVKTLNDKRMEQLKKYFGDKAVVVNWGYLKEGTPAYNYFDSIKSDCKKALQEGGFATTTNLVDVRKYLDEA